MRGGGGTCWFKRGGTMNGLANDSVGTCTSVVGLLQNAGVSGSICQAYRVASKKYGSDAATEFGRVLEAVVKELETKNIHSECTTTAPPPTKRAKPAADGLSIGPTCAVDGEDKGGAVVHAFAEPLSVKVRGVVGKANLILTTTSLRVEGKKATVCIPWTTAAHVIAIPHPQPHKKQHVVVVHTTDDAIILSVTIPNALTERPDTRLIKSEEGGGDKAEEGSSGGNNGKEIPTWLHLLNEAAKLCASPVFSGPERALSVNSLPLPCYWKVRESF